MSKTYVQSLSLAAFVAVCLFTSSLIAVPLAFPGAEGSGRFATGGRGGTVYEVTNLNNSGAGSIVDAVSQPNRTIVFHVSGTIALGDTLLQPKSNTTIAGQTAPGEGICLKGRIYIGSVSNVIIRYIRVRVDAGAANSSGDAIDIASGTNIIIDHVTASYARDEGISCQERSNYVTVQWCIISEALTFESHSFGSLVRGDYGDEKTYHHNLYAHNWGRNPRPGNYTATSTDPEGIHFDFRNNVVYNWRGSEPGYNADTTTTSRYNFVGNVSIAGPESSVTKKAFKESARDAYAHWSGNAYGASYATVAMPADQWSLVKFNGFTEAQIDAYKARSYEIPMEPVTTTSWSDALRDVLDGAGASFPARDVIDSRIVSDVVNGTGHSIATTAEQPEGGWPALYSLPAPDDSDHDGMPDAWETANGLAPGDASDRNYYTLDADYTNLEVYLNSLVSGEIEPQAPAIISAAPTEVYVGEPYSYDVSATGYPAPTFSLSEAPAGMTINAATGLIQWTPSAAGDFDVTVVAANGVDPNAIQSFTITAIVRPSVPPTITSTAPTGVYVGGLYSYDVEATGYPAPTFSLSVSPAGMTINPTTGLIQWTPTTGGFFNVSVVASNGTAPDAVQSFTIEVSLAAEFVLRLNVNGPTVVDGEVTWESDSPYGSGGSLYTFSGATVDTFYNSIQVPIPTDGIYKSVRYYDHSFAIPVPQSGGYIVRMHWVDYHTDVRDNYYDIEGVRVLEHFDPKNFGGIGKAVAKEFQVTVTDGVMNIVASKTSGKGAITSAIEIMSATPPALRIYGTIANVLDVPVEGVLVTAQNGGGTDMTDSSGYYEVLVPYGWSDTLAAVKKDYTFDPPTLVLPATADQVGDFAAQLDADIDNSGIVDQLDLWTLCSNWLTAGDLGTGDLDGSGFINLLDFSEMAEYWLE